jgi:hypothetical protein
MSRPLIITLSSLHRPKEIRGWYDGSRAGFSTDHRRAKPFHTRREARIALEDLRRRFPRQAIEAQAMVVTDQADHITHARLGQRMVGFAAVLALAGGLAGCSQQPLSGSDYLVTRGYIPPSFVYQPPNFLHSLRTIPASSYPEAVELS